MNPALTNWMGVLLGAAVVAGWVGALPIAVTVRVVREVVFR